MEKTRFWKFSPIVNKKISLRASLILSHMALIGLISILILYVNHRIINPVLIHLTLDRMSDSTQFTKDELAQTSTIILNKMNDMVSAITHDLVQPDSSSSFFNYLFQLVKKDPVIQGVHWESAQRTFLSIDRITSQTYLKSLYAANKDHFTYVSSMINAQGDPVQTRYFTQPPFDPRRLPWFRLATRDKMIWTESNSFQNPKLYGITASKAVYGTKNQFLGVLAFKVGIQSFEDLNGYLKISRNDTFLVYDNQYNLLAGHSVIDLAPYLGHTLPFEVLKKIGLYDVVMNSSKHRRPFEKILNFTKKES